MAFFGIFGGMRRGFETVVDVGSHSIKAIIFERSKSGGLPKVSKKIVWKLPSPCEAPQVVTKLHEFIFALAKELGRVPERILIAIGANLAEHSVVVWKIRLDLGGNNLFAEDLAGYFQNLFASHRTRERGMLAYPLEVLVNGYPLQALRGVPREERKRLRWLLPPAAELSFRTLLLTLADTVGAGLAELRRSLGGMTIEFIPLAAAEERALVSSVPTPESIAIDVGGEETTLLLIRDGVLAGVSAFQLGGRHFIRGISRIASIPFEEAEDLKRQYAQGIVGEEKRAMLRDFLAQEAAIWEKRFSEALDLLYPVGPLPADVNLFGGGANLPEIGASARKPEWIRERSHYEMPRVRILEGPRIFDGNTLGGALQGPGEVGLASLIRYAISHEPFF